MERPKPEAAKRNTDLEAIEGLNSETYELREEYWSSRLAIKSLQSAMSRKRKKLPEGAIQALTIKPQYLNNPSATLSESVSSVLSSHDIALSLKLEEEPNSADKANPKNLFMRVESAKGSGLPDAKMVMQYLKTHVDYLQREIDDRKLAVRSLEATTDPDNNIVVIASDSPVLSRDDLQVISDRTNNHLYRYGSAVAYSDPVKIPNSENGHKSSKSPEYHYRVTVSRQDPVSIYIR